MRLPSKSMSGSLGDNANSRPPKPQPISATSTSFEIRLLPIGFSACSSSGWSVCIADSEVASSMAVGGSTA